MIYVLVALALFGHWSMCVYAINRLHATAWPHVIVKAVDLVWYVCLLVLPALFIAAVVWLPAESWLPQQSTWRTLGLLYAIVCWAVVPLAVWHRLAYLAHEKSTPRLVSNHTQPIDVVQRLGHVPTNTLTTTLLSRLPTNQVFQLCVQQKTLQVARLPLPLDGLTITHVSDLHFTGRITKDFHELVVEQANSLASDLIVITGDIIDKPCCFGWLSEVLGKLSAPHGVFFVLGNHDLRIRDEVGLRRELVKQGFIDLGHRYEIIEVNGQPILLAGNEVPWFSPAADMRAAPVDMPAGRPFRVAVAHSPDQYPWARRHDFDLMLAGHTHGGQIRFPVMGPLFSPSYYGVRYSAGTFYQPPTLMHVSRGLSGTRPLRFNCPPELSQLTLRADRQGESGHSS